MKKLIMTVGLPRSGKSTWAKKQPFPIVNPDSIRLCLHGWKYFVPAEPLVWYITKLMVNSLFLAGHDTVILDSTNYSKERRLEWKSPDYIRVYQVFNTSKEECIERAEKENYLEIIPIIEKMHEKFQSIDETEIDI
jgi:predicted kinase